MQILLASPITSDGCLPIAVSAENIIASTPELTALATSNTSARVGTLFVIIDSIICVATITNLSNDIAFLIRNF